MRTSPQVAEWGAESARARRQVQEATERYVAALPTDHRLILGLLASRRGMAPSQLVAGLIADAVGEYQREELRNSPR